MIDRAQLKSETQALGLALSDLQLEMFDAYAEMLVETNKKFNLTAIKNPDEIVTKFGKTIRTLSVFDGTDAPGTVFDESIGHCWYLGEITNEPTCTAAGKASVVCQVCGEAKTETIPAKGHANPMDHVAAKPGTCMDIGNIEYWYCWNCNKYFADKDGKKQLDEDSIYIWDVDHNWKHVKNPAGLLKNGSEYDQCTFCKEKINVKKLTGYATYYVKGFKLAPAKKAFTAKWKKQSTKNQKKFNGYQIRYSTKSSMKGAKYKTAGKKSSSKKITKLKKKTKYYVQVRTYTISKNVKYYSKWSQKKVVKTK